MASINQNIRDIERNIISAVKRAVEDVALDLQGKSQLLAPIDTGDLRGSASTTPVKVVGNIVTCQVGFSQEYALKQHENMSYNHPRGGQAKYLEEPMKRNEGRYKQSIKNAARGGVG